MIADIGVKILRLIVDDAQSGASRRAVVGQFE
jgi:hypothetical protein